MDPFDLKRNYLRYFSERGHREAQSSPLVPENDPSTLFTGSGMQPMIPYLLGEPHPLGVRLVNSQPCLRAQDIEEVGDNRHTTFFEMLGNWSLGSYSKAEQLGWTFDFLTEVAGLDPSRLYASVFGGEGQFDRDLEAIEVWRGLFERKGIQTEVGTNPFGGVRLQCHIVGYGFEQNWWSRAGAPARMPIGEPGGTDSEIYFDFGEHYGLHERSPFRDLPCHPACDCGRFFELGNNVFMNSLKTGPDCFIPLERPNLDFGGGFERILAASSGNPDVFVTNLFEPLIREMERATGKSYAESEDVRRSFRVMADHLRASTMLIRDGVVCSNKDQGYVLRRLLRRAIRHGRLVGAPPELYRALGEIVSEQYGESRCGKGFVLDHIEDEVIRFEHVVDRGVAELRTIVSRGSTDGRELFFVYETFGLPMEMSIEELSRHGVAIDRTQIEREFEAEKTRHRNQSRSGGGERFAGGLADHSLECRRYHTASHLLLRALQLVVSPEIHQHGSNITAKRVRFDVNLDRPLTSEEIRDVERLVNESIKRGLRVEASEMSKTDARMRGVEGMFWEKYPETVRVYTIRDSADGEVFSQEVCGGPHVDETGVLAPMGTFRITGQESIGAGRRRLKAVLA